MPRFLVQRAPDGTLSGLRITEDTVLPPSDEMGTTWIIVGAPTAAHARAQITAFRNGTHPRQALLQQMVQAFRNGTFDHTFGSTGPDGVHWPDD